MIGALDRNETFVKILFYFIWRVSPMPTYDFICQECKKTFTRLMSVAEVEKGSVTCPHCKSDKTEQKPTAFFAVSAKKS